MLLGLVGSLVKNGLGSLAERLFETAVDKGEDIVKSKIKEITGLDIDMKRELTPEQILKFKQNGEKLTKTFEELVEENRHEEKMAMIEIQSDEIAAKDRDSARDMHKVAMEKGSWLNKNFLEILSIIIIIGIGLFEFYILNMDVKDSDLGLITSVQKFVEFIGVGLVGFWFGSSKGSKEKDRILSNGSKKEIK